MKLTIGAVNLDTKYFTEVFLDTLEIAICEVLIKYKNNDINVVIIDNGSVIEIDDICNSFVVNCKLIKNETNIGVAASWNQIIKEGIINDSDYTFICNNDIYWTKNSLLNFIEAFNEIKDAHDNKLNEFGWISLFMNDYKETNKTGIPIILKLESLYWSLRPHADNINSKEHILELLENTYAPWGGIEEFSSKLRNDHGLRLLEMHPKTPCVALSKKCIKEVGLFDEFGGSTGLHEDADYCERIYRHKDLKIGVLYGTFVHHFSCMTRTKKAIDKGGKWVDDREHAFTEKWGISSKTLTLSHVVKIRLDIGSGERPRLDGHWYHMDIDPKFSHLEFIHDCSKPLPFEKETVDEIYCSNNLEHIEWRKLETVLQNWHDCLKENGKLEIRVPNFEFAVSRYLDKSWNLSYKDGFERNLMHLIMGGDNEGYQHLHKSLFDYNSLYCLLNKVGFSLIKNTSEVSSWELRVECIK